MAEPSAVSISSQAQAAVLPPHSLSLAPFAPTTLQICTTSSLSVMTTVVPPSHNPAPGPLKHSAKHITQPLMAEALSFSPFFIPTYPSTAGGKRHRITSIISSSDEISDSSDEDTPKKSMQMLSRSAIHQANVQMALPAMTGHVCIYLPYNSLQTLQILTSSYRKCVAHASKRVSQHARPSVVQTIHSLLRSDWVFIST